MLQAALPRCRRLHELVTKFTYTGVVVADFNKRFLNSTYHSQLDTNSSVEAMTSAALVAARALHDLASGQGSTQELKANTLIQDSAVIVSCIMSSAAHPFNMLELVSRGPSV